MLLLIEEEGTYFVSTDSIVNPFTPIQQHELVFSDDKILTFSPFVPGTTISTSNTSNNKSRIAI